MTHEVSRRGFLTRAGAAAAVAGAGMTRVGLHETAHAEAAVPAVVPFHGEHQAGIATPQQRHLVLAAFDVRLGTRHALAALFGDWTRTAESLAAGVVTTADTGETRGLSANRLTVTLGVGPSLFDERFGLVGRRPDALAPLPAFAGDMLDPQRCGGDLIVQACADDAVVAFHAVRELRRAAGSRAAASWWQAGFLPASPWGSTPRNLLGFKDGSRNLDGRDDAAMRRHVWVGDEASGATEWLRGGSYLVARRVRLRLDDWDADSRAKQEATFGRDKLSGASLGGSSESATPDFAARTATGAPVIPATAHIRLASPETNGGVRLLRRGYSYSDGVDGSGTLDAGLQFLAYQRDPRAQFVVLQQRLAAHDALNEYAVHTGSGVYAVLPGVARGESWGAALVD